jgi:hypothetical protein
MRVVTDRERLETILVLGLAAVLFGYWLEAEWLFWAAAGLLTFGLVAREPARWLAGAWLGFSEVLGRVMSTVILVLFFFLVVVPLLLLVRLLAGVAPSLVRAPRMPGASSFVVRVHKWGPSDFDKGY